MYCSAQKRFRRVGLCQRCVASLIGCARRTPSHVPRARADRAHGGRVVVGFGCRAAYIFSAVQCILKGRDRSVHRPRPRMLQIRHRGPAKAKSTPSACLRRSCIPLRSSCCTPPSFTPRVGEKETENPSCMREQRRSTGPVYRLFVVRREEPSSETLAEVQSSHHPLAVSVCAPSIMPLSLSPPSSHAARFLTAGLRAIGGGCPPIVHVTSD